MIELGELEKNHVEFEKRNVRVVVASREVPEVARSTQERFPHLVVVADSDGKLIKAAGVLHAGAGQKQEDIAAPTTFFIDKQGTVRSLFRPKQVITRLSAKEVLRAVDEKM
ncbi:MAG: redoxin domain-containing protein [Pirellulaceae bacterium]